MLQQGNGKLLLVEVATRPGIGKSEWHHGVQDDDARSLSPQAFRLGLVALIAESVVGVPVGRGLRPKEVDEQIDP